MPVNRDQVVAEIDSHLILLMPDGQEIGFEDKDTISSVLREYPSLENLVDSFVSKGKERPGILANKAMQDLEWAGYEPASDRGHLRFYPKGTLVHNLIRDWHERVLIERLGASEIKTPLIYDWSEPDILSEAQTFFDRLYYVYSHDKKKEFVLRFGGDFGLFRMLSSVEISYRQLPFRVFEYAPSFRYERSGELRGIQKGRTFSFFDLHSMCSDHDQGWDEYCLMYKFQADMAVELGIEFAVEFTAVEAVFQDHKERLLSVLKPFARPVLVELLSKAKHYWSIKHAFHDENTHKFFNVQLDFDNSARYGITYTASDGQKTGCTICHCSLGSIERWMFLVLEKALKKDPPTIPLWLSPTQIRIVPIGIDKTEGALDLARRISAASIRVDVDDRQKNIGWRVHRAKKEWIPYIVVFGEREEQTGQLKVQTGNEPDQTLAVDELIDLIRRQTSHMPYRPLVNVRVSSSPVFQPS